MTEDRLPLAELLAKAGDSDFLRSVAEAVLQMLMEADVEGLIGAGRHERSGERLTYPIARSSPGGRASSSELASLAKATTVSGPSALATATATAVRRATSSLSLALKLETSMTSARLSGGASVPWPGCRRRQGQPRGSGPGCRPPRQKRGRGRRSR